jgi:uncharacterized phage infection (PIP) family protein YhgE
VGAWTKRAPVELRGRRRENAMGSVTLETWERFYDRVVVRGSDWPRNLWFAAVEDGLSAALPAQSRLLVQYRQDVAELRDLERTASGSYRDATRMAQLEAEIMRLIGIADQSIREQNLTVDEQHEPALPPPLQDRPRIGFWLGALILGVIMLCGALLGVTYYYQQRMTERMERDLVALQQRLIAQAADERAALEVRIRSADRIRENVGALQAELRANVDEFNQVMSASLRSMTALSDGGITGLERQLPYQGSDLGEALNGLRERAATLGRQLDQVDHGVNVLAQRLPDLERGSNRLAERLEAATAGFERVERQVATIQAQAPEVALWLEGQRQALAQDLEGRRQTMSELGAEIATLQRALDNSRGQLATLQGSLEQDLALTGRQGVGLERAGDRMGAAEQQQPALVTQVDAGFGTESQDEMQKQIDTILAQLAEEAGLSAPRGDDGLKRAEAEAARRLEMATEQAIDDLSKAHGAQLAELSRWASATRSELEQTRAGLIAGWRGMDEAVAQRQLKVLAELDQYAATLEFRVQEFLKALDVIAARSDG